MTAYLDFYDNTTPAQVPFPDPSDRLDGLWNASMEIGTRRLSGFSLIDGNIRVAPFFHSKETLAWKDAGALRDRDRERTDIRWTNGFHDQQWNETQHCNLLDPERHFRHYPTFQISLRRFGWLGKVVTWSSVAASDNRFPAAQPERYQDIIESPFEPWHLSL